MDYLQGYAPQLFTFYNNVSPHLWSLYGVFRTGQDLFSTHIFPIVAPIVVSGKRQLLAANPDIASLGLLVLLLVISLLVLRMLWRAIIATIWFAVRVMFVVSLLVMAALIYLRGWGLIDDINDWGSEMGRVYQGEKGRWESVAQQGGPAWGGSDARRGMRGSGTGTWA
ncbi:MAG: hypothetical protein M4579_002592 [Chaenotheca gracillima]|nr:MAG: hypothetical protein M4579_002592 [Chaenotheca gracillima]